ncbi:hypothetical protein [Nocardioides mangrovi]|uniref:Methionyl-tRNA formyltransferase n=1 Tax=Nocardioides mangrovi TaxID=2874580 RepID=A0ABS7U960_9ACTN|nr:hypothetical protein [Nocardioides mangrovi]MBZ5737523.1 hypothetical protein [Nocardioides mangrovi]
MALVRTIEREERAGSRVHPTEVDCRWQVVHGAEGVTLFQLSTYGSDDRQSEPKVSQTIQLDREIAALLIARLRETFDL